MRRHSGTIGDRNHRRCRIQFHRTGPQRNHGCSQTDILAVQTLEVAHQFGLRMIMFEDLLLHIVDVAHTALFDSPESLECLIRLLVLRHVIRCLGEDLNQFVHIIDIYRLIQSQPDPSCGIIIEIDIMLARQIAHALDPSFFVTSNPERVKELRILLVVAVSLKHLAQIHRLAMNTFCDRAYSFRTVIHAVHASHHRRQRFGSTDIRSSTFAFDMLLTGL